MAKITTLSCDIETYSSIDLAKCGVYRYSQSPDFEILLFGYSIDGGEVQVIDLACGEKIPPVIVSALSDPTIKKWAYNAQFERICLSSFLGFPRALTSTLMDGIAQWCGHYTRPPSPLKEPVQLGLEINRNSRKAKTSENITAFPAPLLRQTADVRRNLPQHDMRNGNSSKPTTSVM